MFSKEKLIYEFAFISGNQFKNHIMHLLAFEEKKI